MCYLGLLWLQEIFVCPIFSIKQQINKWKSRVSAVQIAYAFLLTRMSMILEYHEKPGGKKDNKIINRGQQVTGMVQENLKLAAFLFHQR